MMFWVGYFLTALVIGVPAWISFKLFEWTNSWAVAAVVLLVGIVGAAILARYIYAIIQEKEDKVEQQRRERRAKEARDAKIREIYGQDFFELSEIEQQNRVRFVDASRKRREELRKEQERQRRLEEERRLEELARQRHLEEVERRRDMEWQIARTKARIEQADRERAEKREKSARPICYPNGCSTCNRDCPFDL